MTEDDGAWFAPKRWGYGAGLPIAWQGWALIAGLVGVAVALVFALAPAHQGYLGVAVIGVNLLAMPLIAKKTRGGWKWRNGRE